MLLNATGQITSLLKTTLLLKCDHTDEVEDTSEEENEFPHSINNVERCEPTVRC